MPKKFKCVMDVAVVCGHNLCLLHYVMSNWTKNANIYHANQSFNNSAIYFINFICLLINAANEYYFDQLYQSCYEYSACMTWLPCLISGVSFAYFDEVFFFSLADLS